MISLRARHAALFALALSCGDHGTTTVPLPEGKPTPDTYFTSSVTDKTFFVADHMLASIEMQISGEPFAQLLGRDLAGYDRFNAHDRHLHRSGDRPPIADPLGYSIGDRVVRVLEAADEQHLVRVGRRACRCSSGRCSTRAASTGDCRRSRCSRDRMQHFALASRASGGRPGQQLRRLAAARRQSAQRLRLARLLAGRSPSSARSIRRSSRAAAPIARLLASPAATRPASTGAQRRRRLRVRLQLAQPRRTATRRSRRCSSPTRSASRMWKQGLWVINYWQTLHDVAGNPITQVADADLPQVGVPGNTVVGQYPDPDDPTGKALVDGVARRLPRRHLARGLPGPDDARRDGQQVGAAARAARSPATATTLGGFAIDEGGDRLRLHVAAALVAGVGRGDRDRRTPPPAARRGSTSRSRRRSPSTRAEPPARPRRRWPAASPSSSRSPTSTTPTSAGSRRSRATFDGDPFPADNQLARRRGDAARSRARRHQGRARRHRSAALRRRAQGARRQATRQPAAPCSAARIVAAVDAAYAIVGMRTALRSISARRSRSTRTTRPTPLGAPTALDARKLDGAPRAAAARASLAAHPRRGRLPRRQARRRRRRGRQRLRSRRRHAPIRRRRARVARPRAIRGLLDAYLATSEREYRQAAMRVYGRSRARASG